MKKVWVDGNPWKIAIVTENGMSLLHALLKEHTNNESEYIAVIAALNEEPGDLEIISDSQLVINQIEFRNEKYQTIPCPALPYHTLPNQT